MNFTALTTSPDLHTRAASAALVLMDKAEAARSTNKPLLADRFESMAVALREQMENLEHAEWEAFSASRAADELRTHIARTVLNCEAGR